MRLLLVVVACSLAGCESEAEQRVIEANTKRYEAAQVRLEAEAKASGDNCLKRGGIIVRSSWDSRIVDCK